MDRRIRPMYKWTPIMSTVMEIGYATSNPSAPATRTISTKLPSHTMAGWRQHLVTPGYSCLRNLAKWDEKWGYDYTGNADTNATSAKPFLLISTAAASVVATARVDLRCPDGNLVVIAKTGPERCLRRIRHKNRLSLSERGATPLIIGFSALLPGYR